MSEYFIFKPRQTPENCTIGQCPESLDKKKWRIAEGVRMGEHYPTQVRLDMDKSHKGIGVPDLIHNTLHMLLVSSRLKVLLAQHAEAEIEFLPFALHDHKGRVAAEECYIANVIGTLDCVDRARTEADESHINPGQFSGLFRLFLDGARIDPRTRIFRITPEPSVLVVRDDLREVFELNGIAGAQYIAMGEECFIY